MKPYEDWNALMSAIDTEEKAEAFWPEYYAAEQANYQKILTERKVYEGTLAELAQYFEMEEGIFAGFLDGINTSLKTPNDFENLESDSKVLLDIDYEKLFFNMMEAKAKWLYTLKEWDDVLSEEKRKEITKDFRTSKIAVSDKVGRNEPCPCGSGKKYKKCCGA